MDDDDETTIEMLPQRHNVDLRISLTKAERKLLDEAAGQNTAAWARLVLLDATAKLKLK